MSRCLQILAELAIDVLVAIVLFVTACIGSGWCQRNLTPNVDLYFTWLAVWMMPFCLYAYWRGVTESHPRVFIITAVLFVSTYQVLIFLGVPLDRWWSLAVWGLTFYTASWFAERIGETQGTDGQDTAT